MLELDAIRTQPGMKDVGYCTCSCHIPSGKLCDRKCCDNPWKYSVEQMCRDLLEVAIKDGLVGLTNNSNYKNPDPQTRSSGELVGMANLLSRFLKM